jgi:type II secretory pathway pseudopilin PulG
VIGMMISPKHARSREDGYSLLMVIFMVATMLVLAVAAVPNVLVQGRRERETEMVWRGEQYKRAIGLYFTKFGRYPTKIDDLTKQTNGIRFLRQAYTDPMNKEDGSWRFIYVGPNGQLIGSLGSQSLLQSALSIPGLSGAATQPGGAASGATQTGQATTSTSSALAANPLASQPQPLGGTVIGGNIIGVGSKVKQSSLRVYQGADNYERWEFIWNPLRQTAIPGQPAPVNPNAPAGSQPTPQTPPGTATPSSTDNPAQQQQNPATP